MKKSPLKIFIIILISLILVLFFLRFILGGPEDNWICQNNTWIKHGNPQNPPPKTGCGNTIVGGDRDKHGCIGSAGYSWCAPKNKCLRVWEEQCK